MNRITKKETSKFLIVTDFLLHYMFLTIGAIITVFAIEGFLLPNKIIDGGTIGIAMMTSYVTKLNLGVIALLVNIPFLLLAYTKKGKAFTINIMYAILVFGLSITFMHHFTITEVPLLATVFGGIILGFGVGIILRNNGAIDGTEILAIRLAKRFGFSVGEIILFFNIFIYSVAGFLYGWDSAMYSILTYFIASRVIDIVLEGFNSSKSAMIISDNAKEIGDAIINELDTSVTYQKGKGGYSGKEKTIVYCVISRLEIAKIKQLIRGIDPSAFFVIQEVYEVDGIKVKEKKHKHKKKTKKKEPIQ